MSIIYRYDDLCRLVRSQGEMGALGLSYATLYASPLVTINRGGYTKHYFEGSNRVCTAIGGGFGGVDWSEVAEQVPTLHGDYRQMHEMQDESVNKTFDGCIGVGASVKGVYNLPAILEKQERWRNVAEPLHFYHGDHLGSAAYLTDRDGHVVQTLAYLPYGEDWVEQNGLSDTSRLGMYRYNGKERDGESGYLYYGARYYWSELWNGWLSVDPMSDKYPGVSPYAYCVWNPVMFVDPEGEKIWIVGDDGSSYTYRNGKVYTEQGDIYEGNDEFIRNVSTCLSNFKEMGVRKEIRRMEKSHLDITILRGNDNSQCSLDEEGESNPKIGSGSFVTYNPLKTKTKDGKRHPSYGLAHELGHCYDAMRGKIDDNKVDVSNESGEVMYISISEIRAVRFENRIRPYNNQRKTYDKFDLTPYKVIMKDENGMGL